MAAEPQHMEALGKANGVRLGIAEVKRQIADGRMTIADALDEGCMQNVWLYDLLKAQHRWGKTRTRRALMRAMLSESKTIGSLTERQRRKLLEEVR